MLRALVKQTLSRAQIDRLADDIEHACATLEKKGGAHKPERKQDQAQPGLLRRRTARARAHASPATRCARRAGR